MITKPPDYQTRLQKIKSDYDDAKGGEFERIALVTRDDELRSLASKCASLSTGWTDLSYEDKKKVINDTIGQVILDFYGIVNQSQNML